MGRLVYASIGSLDGFIADEQGSFDWSAPDDEVHAYLNDRDRGVTLELYGRRLDEVMKVWESYYASPIIVGRGKPCLPEDLRLDLTLLEVHRFGCGVVHLAYQAAR